MKGSNMKLKDHFSLYPKAPYLKRAKGLERLKMDRWAENINSGRFVLDTVLAEKLAEKYPKLYPVIMEGRSKCL